jgi:hypothetical protein
MEPVDRQGSATELDRDVSGLVHKAGTRLRGPQADTDSQSEGMSNLNSVVRGISGTSVMEIDGLSHCAA